MPLCDGFFPTPFIPPFMPFFFLVCYLSHLNPARLHCLSFIHRAAQFCISRPMSIHFHYPFIQNASLSCKPNFQLCPFFDARVAHSHPLQIPKQDYDIIVSFNHNLLAPRESFPPSYSKGGMCHQTYKFTPPKGGAWPLPYTHGTLGPKWSSLTLEYPSQGAPFYPLTMNMTK